MQLKYIGKILPWGRNVHEGCSSAVQDATEELIAEIEIQDEIDSTERVDGT